MSPGKPCFFCQVGEGCGIYPERPKSPCIDFRCEWLEDEGFPGFLYPKDSGIVAVRKELKGHQFLFFTSTGDSIPDIHLSLLIEIGVKKYGNVAWQLRGKEVFFVGSKDFLVVAEENLRG